MEYQLKNILGFPGYKIDTKGQIWSCKTFQGKFSSKYHQLNGSLIKDKRHKDGRFKVTLSKGGKYYTFMVAHLVAKTFIKNPKNLPYICHNDSNPSNNSVENLRWDNQKGNMKDRMERKLYGLNKGSKNGGSVLDERKISMIRLLLDFTDKKLSSIFGVHRRTISDIRYGKTWKHI